MTAPAGLTRLVPPPSLLSPAPSATLSPPLSEPEQQRADSGGRLKFFGRDGHVLLELSHGPADIWEKERRWVVVAEKPPWLPPTVAAPVGSITPHAANGQSSQHSPWTSGRVRRKQQSPGRRPACPLLCWSRCRPPPAASRLPGPSLRRLSRRPCRALQPGTERVPPARRPAAGPAVSPATRAARLADAVRRLTERRQRAAARTQRAARTDTAAAAAAVARPATPRKRAHAAGRAPRASRRPSPAVAAVHRHSTVHSIDSLLAAPSRAAPPPPPPPPALVVPTPLRPAPFAAYLSGCGGELCAVPPPAGRAPFPLVSPLLYAQLSGAPLLPPPPGRLRPSPAHAAGGYTAAYDYSQYNDEPLNLSKR